MYDVLYSLLRLSLGTSSELPRLIGLSDGDWEQLLLLARRQAVVGLVYDALGKLPSESLELMPSRIGSALMLEADKIVRRNAAVDSVAADILRVLSENGISATLMKGPAAGAYYPVPEYRTPGDIDLYCPAGQHGRVLELLCGRMGASPGGSAPDASSHCKVQGIDIDIHSAFFDFESPGKEYPELDSAYATLLMLSSHILKHVLGTGVGLRQICDMAMACRALSGHYDVERLAALYQSHGVLKWNLLLSDFIALRLSVDTGLRGQSPADVPALEKIVQEGGNFGHHSPSRAAALSKGEGMRKADTLLRLSARLPFALKYAPGPFRSYLKLLLKGNSYWTKLAK